MIRFYQLFIPLLWSNRSSTFLWERTSIEVHLTLQYSLYIVYHIGKGFLNTNFTKVIDILWAAYAIYHNIFDSPILKLLFNFFYAPFISQVDSQSNLSFYCFLFSKISYQGLSIGRIQMSLDVLLKCDFSEAELPFDWIRSVLFSIPSNVKIVIIGVQTRMLVFGGNDVMFLVIFCRVISEHWRVCPTWWIEVSKVLKSIKCWISLVASKQLVVCIFLRKKIS